MPKTPLWELYDLTNHTVLAVGSLAICMLARTDLRAAEKSAGVEGAYVVVRPARTAGRLLAGQNLGDR